ADDYSGAAADRRTGSNAAADDLGPTAADNRAARSPAAVDDLGTAARDRCAPRETGGRDDLRAGQEHRGGARNSRIELDAARNEGATVVAAVVDDFGAAGVNRRRIRTPAGTDGELTAARHRRIAGQAA